MAIIPPLRSIARSSLIAFDGVVGRPGRRIYCYLGTRTQSTKRLPVGSTKPMEPTSSISQSHRLEQRQDVERERYELRKPQFGNRGSGHCGAPDTSARNTTIRKEIAALGADC